MMVSSILAQRPLCAVDCSHYGSAVGNFGDNPFDCHNYYVCTSISTYVGDPVSCPSGEAFDTNTKTCMDPTLPGFSCTPPCEQCTFDCALSVMGKAALRMYGLEYYVCDKHGSIVTTVKCDPETYFDGQGCQADIHKTCSCRPPHCTHDDVRNNRLKPDYFNCTNFYHCNFEGLPDETCLDRCPSGEIFSRINHKCDPEAKCSAPCAEYEQY
ncbi:uncharacterized protein LOC123513015 [Portunus trituberculatus]|uniref:uncharacterized protein LOC123513015 n=1 Tax=Portunus trituberculatus TaxID=210409 RepID=UPI001E1CFB37|nr:uncharacterized protein LOC123513015 [Portunus trituberculatus]